MTKSGYAQRRAQLEYTQLPWVLCVLERERLRESDRNFSASYSKISEQNASKTKMPFQKKKNDSVKLKKIVVFFHKLRY